jgi:sec-independent protein translocase protein TatA
MGSLGPTEIILILLVLVLLFGAKKLPELARGSGRALRIFKAETKGLMDDDDDVPAGTKTEEQRQIEAQRTEAQRLETQRVDSERVESRPAEDLHPEPGGQQPHVDPER